MRKFILALILILVLNLGQSITFAQGQDIYFTAYVNRIQNKIKSNWIMPHGQADKKTVVAFNVDKTGAVSNISIEKSSENKNFDEAAVSAISTSAPFETFPAESNDETVKISFIFKQGNIEAVADLESNGIDNIANEDNETSEAAYSDCSAINEISSTSYHASINKGEKKKKKKEKKPKKFHLKKYEAYPYDCSNSFNAGVSKKSLFSGAASLIIWPGLGQLMNHAGVEKVETHAILGFLFPFRIWSCYDAVVDRKGGVWDNRI